jgi:REP element-mobilizing transposase RayT
MGQSLALNYLHITFSTKHRIPFLGEEVSHLLYAYIGNICKEMEFQPLKIGGYVDHVHILCMLSRKVALMDLMEEVKAHSSKWMKSFGGDCENFYWQKGYAAFSVNPKQVKAVTNYILNQQKHHQKTSFQDELRFFMNRYGMNYDERYVWD